MGFPASVSPMLRPNPWWSPFFACFLSCSGSGSTGSEAADSSAAKGDAGPDAASDDAGRAPSRCEQEQDPGRVTLHRLNRAEYDNTVAALLGDTTRPATDFPADDVGHGFDNIADVLSLSTVLVEKYALAAERLVHAALLIPRTMPEVLRFEAELLMSVVGAPTARGWNLWSNGEIGSGFTVTTPGPYRLTILAGCQLAGPDACHLNLRVDAQDVEQFVVDSPLARPGLFGAEVALTEGMHHVAAEFTNDYYDPESLDPAQRDRNLHVDAILIEGPLDLDPNAVNPVRETVLICQPETPERAHECAREIFATFGRRAFRRALSDDELGRLVGFLDLALTQGDDFETGIGLGLEAILLSPHFMFRVELDPMPDDLRAHPLSGDELATRLSYFLWSTTPDDELFAAADRGELTTDAGLEAQVVRMLDDRRAYALLDNFAGQWLHLRNMADVAPDYAHFPSFDDELRAAMSAETRAFLEVFLNEDLSLLDLLDAPFGFLNERLALHYGIEGLDLGDGLTRVDLSETERGGLLTQSSILTVTSFPTRTSPVKRGKWVLEQLLCTTPPPPPPGVEGLMDTSDSQGTLRERLEQHRADPTCASCHQLMDPIGFGLESFDGIGASRELDHGEPIDDSGTFPSGQMFAGAKALAGILKADPALPDCAARRLFTYALGRAPGGLDQCAMKEIVEQATASGFSLRELALSVALSPPFRTRHGEAPSEAAVQEVMP